MKDGFIKAAAAVPELKVADCAFNADKTIELAKKAANTGAVITVFPELGITGYTCQDLFFHDTLIKAAERETARVAEATAGLGTLIFIGVPFRRSGKIYNVAAVLWRGKLLGLVPKSLIPNYGEFYERRQFTPAKDGTETVNYAGQTCPFGTKLLFCHDRLDELTVAA